MHPDRQRLGQYRSLKAHAFRDLEQRLTQDGIAYQQVFGESTMNRITCADAVTALHRVDHYPLAGAQPRHAAAQLIDGADQLMTQGHRLRRLAPDVTCTSET